MAHRKSAPRPAERDHKHRYQPQPGCLGDVLAKLRGVPGHHEFCDCGTFRFVRASDRPPAPHTPDAAEAENLT